MEPNTANLFDKTDADRVFTVSQFIDLLNQKIKPLAAKILGEVSEAKLGPTGHMYFSLKDEKTGHVISCAIWRSRYEMFGVNLTVGLKIIASGHAEVYAPSGRLSFICDTIELAGEGALKKEYDKLLKKLAGEGMFDPERKRAIPAMAKLIGVITSKQGAVIHDFLNNLGRFGFMIEMIDSRVEGQSAVNDLLASIKTFKKRGIEVLVIIRGGGSLEAMLAFNNELVVREIAAFPVPVIAGIGHDKDVPLASMAADMAVSTPTAAANLLTRSWAEAEGSLERQRTAIIEGYKNALNGAAFALARHAQTFRSFRYVLKEARTLLDGVLSKILAQIRLAIFGSGQQLVYLEETLAAKNPEHQLKLGYSIVKARGKILRSIKGIRPGETIEINVSDGSINSQVIKLSKKS
jgi:exodeoxyribonuclease VII large subunit